MKKLIRNVLRSSWLQRAVGGLTAEFLRLVWRTNSFSFDPCEVYEIVEPQRRPFRRYLVSGELVGESDPCEPDKGQEDRC